MTSTIRNAELRASTPTVILGGMPIARLSRSATAELVCAIATGARAVDSPVIMTSANGQVLSEYARRKELRALFDQADLVSADGQPMVVLSSLLTRTPVPDRCATTDLFHDVSRLLPDGARYFLLGTSSTELARALLRIQRSYPHITIVGARDGYFGADEEDAVVDAINEAAPDVLWIAMGVPHELDFAIRHRARLSQVKVIKTSGGLFNFLSGSRSRAPQWMQIAGLEWLYRLMLEPRRLLARYVTTNCHSLLLLLTRTR